MANMNLTNKDQDASLNFEPKRSQFTIGSMSIVIELLTKLYSNPKATLTQEYISNARDANREVNSKRPIEITAPTKFSANMTIRDFGPGLTKQRIEDVFLKYGASTKKNDNNQTGGFGIGGKSAWSYTDSFTIVSYVNGLKSTYVAHKSSGEGNLDVISEEFTKEPNGVAIVVPINPRDTDDFKDAILKTVIFWNDNEKPVLYGFDGDVLGSLELTKTVINNNFMQVNNTPCLSQIFNSTYLAVIDGIPYEIKDGLNVYNSSSYRLADAVKNYKIFTLPNGILHIAPSREGLVQDQHNTQTINNLADKAITDIRKHVNKILADHVNINDGLRVYVDLHKKFKVEANYKGYGISYDVLKFSYAPSNVNMFSCHEIRNRRGKDKVHTSGQNSINIHDIETIYIDDIQDSSLAKRGHRIKKAIHANGRNRVHLIKETALDNTIYKRIIADFNPKLLSSIDISDYRINRQAKIAGVPVVKEDLCVHFYKNSLDPKQVTLKDVKETIYYAEINSDFYKQRANKYSEMFYYMKHDFGFISTANLKLIEGNKKFVHISQYINKYKLSDNDVKAHIYYTLEKHAVFNSVSSLKMIKDSIKDKRVKKVLDVELPKEYSSIPDIFKNKIEKHNLYKKVADIIKNPKQFNEYIDSKYPLVSAIRHAHNVKDDFKKDLINYINSK